ncbi:4-hydroxybenzoate polyprenyltransferase [Rubricella aquisinus]|uniref:4-hydroxybenzoate octaprenyltransferase n=1 Tax=Rubricella aquisinus TaxID=2028108 RepID=A0A840WJC9_9RHOB|nr:4-hydroxybenzoate octaprenyltransferase [Rubricella aquisinus]MBB5514621.1 4-hydroxybenzoate polyprenyltransferase [Rubricella aquisinus]
MTEPYDTPATAPEESPVAGRVADATDANWVDRFAPPWARPYLRLSRADRPAGTWLLLLPCWWGLGLGVVVAGGWSPLAVWIALGCAAGAFLMRGAGCTWNDLSDVKFDAAVARTKSRPLPSGQVTKRQAFAWLVFQALIAFAILLTFPPVAIALGVLSLLPVAVYPFAKRFTWWPQVFLGLAFNWGALLAYAAVTGRVDWGAGFLYVAGIAWTLFYDTIYAHQDKEDDALIGVKSTARLFGAATGKWLFGFLAATVTLAAAGIIVALVPLGATWPMLIGLVGVWGFGLHMMWQMRGLDIDDPAKCLVIFRSNRDAGLILAVTLLLSGLFA